MGLNRFQRAVLRCRCAYSVLAGKSFSYSKAFYDQHRILFSQEGEDAVLERVFPGVLNGFYVDIGAHHPQRFSNTYVFYLKGWRGINVDPLPGSKQRFDILRKRDINLEVGVSDVHQELVYYSFKEPALNTFDPGVAEGLSSLLISETRIQMYTLCELLDQYLPAGQVIDFLSIDVEGLDLQVLRSNDWSRYRPTYVLAESLGMRDVSSVLQSPLNAYMVSQGYSLFAKCVNTLFFQDNEAA
jgi:FkbM family methyltransferase